MCKGTTNGEDVFIIKKDLIPEKTLRQLNEAWISNHGGIPVDLCIADEVRGLIVEGVVTVGSCCGHGKWNAHVLIPHSEVDKVEKLGYETIPFNDYYEKVNLKTGTQLIK